MIKKTSSINHVEETVNVKWCVSKFPQYTFEEIVFPNREVTITGDSMSA